MALEDLVRAAVTFTRDNAEWAPLIVGALAFGESLAVISFVVPATGILVGIGLLIGASGIDFWPVWLGAAIGGILGDWLSYWVGDRFRDDLLTRWPLRNYPEAMARATAFTEKYGAWGVFFGRFSGPLRAFVPLAAGLFRVPPLLFQAANITSAQIWAFGLLAPGAGLAHWIG